MYDKLRRIADTVRLSRATQAVPWHGITLARGIKASFRLGIGERGTKQSGTR